MLEIIYLHVISFLLILLIFFVLRCLKHKRAHRGFVKDCFKKIAKEHHLVEAGKLSLGVYHDICNIVSASNLAWQQLKENGDDAETVNNIASQGLKINQRVIRLLKSYRRCLEKDNEAETFDINQEIHNTLSVFNFYFLHNNINLELSLSQSCFLKGSGSMFFRVLINLLSNAVEAFSKEELNKKIQIRTFYKNSNLVLEIIDNGCGISGENLDKIFEIFFSLKDTKSEDSKNCGLGLAVVRDIVVNDLGAKIEVESTLGQGSVFRVCF